MKRLIYYYFIIVLLCSACKDTSKKDDTLKLQQTKGNRYYGGAFRLNETEYIKTLFPLNIVDVYSYRVATQIYEGLFKLDPKNLKVVQSLAESYNIDSTKTIYTVRLRKGVKFHNNACFTNGKGREVKAQDIEYCFKKAATQSVDNQAFHILQDANIKGVSRYYNQTEGDKKPDFDLEGVKVLDDYTIQFKLDRPNALFLYTLARPELFIYPREAYEKYGLDMRINAVGTGPFQLASVEENVSITLTKNQDYYQYDKFGNRLPFLNSIQVLFMKDKKTELFEFRKNNLDMVYRLPNDFIVDIIDEVEKTNKYKLQRKPEMQTQMLMFMNKTGVFQDINVRKALSFAIDRDRILEYVLNGEGYAAGHHGVTSPSFKGYDTHKIKGFSYNPDSAKFYLSKAGYPNGEGFPKISLDLNSEGERHTVVALEVQRQLKNILNIDMSLQPAPHAMITEKGLSGQYNLLRMSWVADFPNPEAFLRMLYGKNIPAKIGQPSFPNIPRYESSEFDSLYEQALKAPTEEEVFNYFIKAENAAMKDAPVIVLWYDEGFRLLQSYVKNFPNNPMQYRDFSAVYLEPKNSDTPNPIDESNDLPEMDEFDDIEVEIEESASL